MPIEVIIAMLVATVVIVMLVAIVNRKNIKISLSRLGQKQSIVSSVLPGQPNFAENAVALSEIESLILTSGDGLELALTRPNMLQNAGKKYREISIRGTSALGQVIQGAMPVLAQAQTLNQIAKAAPNGLFTATGSVQDLMRYSDGTVASFVRKNNQFGAHSGFAEVAIRKANPAAIIGGAMQAMAMVSGQYYMNEISVQLKGVNQKLDKLIGYHHDEKVGILKSVNWELCELTSKTNTDVADIIACQRLGEKCSEIYFEYKTRLDNVNIDVKERWINKAKELRELGSSIDDSELNLTIQMCYQSSILYEKCKLAGIAVRMKIGSGQERFIFEMAESLRMNIDETFHRSIRQYINQHYAPVLEKTEKIVETKKVPLLSGNTAKEIENIQRRQAIVLETIADESDDLTQGLLRSLSEPKETLIMLDATSGNQRMFVLDS